MIWNVFFVVFVVLVLAAIGLTVWFLKLGKRIFLLIPLLLLAAVWRTLPFTTRQTTTFRLPR